LGHAHPIIARLGRCSRLALEGDRLIYRVTGSGFLKHMVRNIVGVLLEAGKGNLDRAGLLARLEPGG
jgi:tRNA pseudouridine38-40 synthase